MKRATKSIVDNLTEPEPVDRAISNGAYAKLVGLMSRPELNGQLVLVQEWDADLRRYEVQFEDGSEGMIREANLSTDFSNVTADGSDHPSIWSSTSAHSHSAAHEKPSTDGSNNNTHPHEVPSTDGSNNNTHRMSIRILTVLWLPLGEYS
jgi:hypothetical protein